MSLSDIDFQQAAEKMPSKGLRLVALWVIVIWGMSQARDFLIPLCVAGLLAFMMIPLIRLLKRAYLPDWLAILISLVVLVLPIPAFGFLVVSQLHALIASLPMIVSSLSQTLSQLGNTSWGIALHLNRSLSPDQLSRQLATTASDALHLIMSSLGAVLGATTELVLVLTFTVLLLGTRSHLRRIGEKLLERSRLVAPVAVLEEGVELIERFLLARFTIVLLVAVVDSAILWIFGLPYQVLVGTWLGVMTLLPAIGFILGIIPMIFVALAVGSGVLRTLFMVLAVWNVSNIDNFLLTPKFVGRRLNINALSSFVGVFGGGLLWGVPGMLLSIPILGILRIVFSEIPGLEPWGELLAEREGKPRAEPDSGGGGEGSANAA